MKLHKRILKSEATAAVLCWLAAQFIRIADVTTRWTVVGAEIPRRFWDEGRPFVLAFWHGRMLMTPFCWDRRKPVHMLVSAHRDGQLGARAMAHLGIRSVTGSKTRGGAAGFRAMLRVLKNGEYVAIAPDGPRGPRMRASPGIVDVARLSGAPVVPLGYSKEKRKLLRSWDRFLVALPFGRGSIVWGEPIAVPREAKAEAAEAWRAKVEDALNAVTAEADRLCGHAPVEPAPLDGAPASGGQEGAR